MPLRDLRRIWSARKQSTVPADSGGLEGGGTDTDTENKAPLCSLPLLQVWPSQDSPRGEADGQSFVFPSEGSGIPAQHDSGIDSVQVILSQKTIFLNIFLICKCLFFFFFFLNN